MVVVDTSIIVDHLRRQSGISVFAGLLQDYPTQTFAVALVSIQELYTGRSSRNTLVEEKLLMVFGNMDERSKVDRAAGKLLEIDF